ncbi:MAG TPA: hypothetical protein DEF85_06165 [Clostridiaceae bacterium]|jgi:hypothetical protein|nr:hypothetical protein [Clostridiaceae bacterium]HBF77303.1 hypothetical protein [Clostridiaceae bacterium]HBG38242.1 hypothetical protein [Clostridiaceae bacterium]HBN28233.1 hypothetical protein [Clostridiaceae bacterium]HBX48458.1 hypothetical protein [Clostridiaceae bacterium]
MAYKILSRCPVCNSKLKVVKLKCDNCGTVIENEFELSKFAYLSAEELNFIEVFLKCRGSIKDVEKELGVSYPTVRGKLDDVLSSLGYTVTKEKSPDNKEVLDSLEKGEITPDEAIKILNNEGDIKNE